MMSVHHPIISIHDFNKEILVMSRKLKILQKVNEAARDVNTRKVIQSGHRVVSMCRETDGQTDRRIDRWLFYLLKSGFYRMDKQTNRWTY